jgi:hypothetical protein
MVSTWARCFAAPRVRRRMGVIVPNAVRAVNQWMAGGAVPGKSRDEWPRESAIQQAEADDGA